MKNTVQLCTYVDRFSDGNIQSLKQILEGPLAGLFGGLHLLPFYYPIDGSDAGFDPIDHTLVDSRLGNWDDVKSLSEQHELMADMIVNHMSAQSKEFIDYKKNGSLSRYADLFLSFDKVFPNGASEQDLLTLYRPRPGLPFSKIKFEDGRIKLIWTTFTSNQVDIDVNSPCGQQYLLNILDELASAGVRMLRLDAAGYAVKKAGTTCFMTDETFNFIAKLRDQASVRGLEVLVEIHSHYLTQVAISKHADYVYDFALPPLVLHALHFADAVPLQQWLKISPHNCISVLDTHDGIGIVDVATDKEVGAGLLNDSQIDQLVEAIHSASGGNSLKATGNAASNVDLYQVNCTFYDALGSHDQRYLLARLTQILSPGIPQIYYVGLLAGVNDMDLLASTGVGRDINRHYYNREEICSQMDRPVVRNLLALIKFRNSHPAFQTGKFCLHESSKTSVLKISWKADDCAIHAQINFATLEFEVAAQLHSQQTVICEWSGFETISQQQN